MRSLVRVVIVVSLVSIAAGVIAACKQGQGDRCQIDEDCSGGLICTKLGFCGTDQQNPGPDATEFDARPDGAEPPDGGPDANLPDAELPAPPDGGPDANLPDANLPDV